MNLYTTWICIFFIICQYSLPVYSQPENLNRRYIPSAININTKNLKKCAASAISSPLFVTAVATAGSLVVNTGYSVQTTNQIKEGANATGGVLGEDGYSLVNFLYYWAGNNSKGITGTTIDGKGFPYEARLFNKNNKYATLEEAVEHKDGIFDFVFLFNICSTTNLVFEKLSKIIQRVARAGSFTPAFVGTQIISIDFIPLNSPYYSYRGTIRDVDTGKTYKCSTVVVIKPNPGYCITQKQFDETFGPLKNFQGKSFSNTLPRDPSPGKVSLCKVVTQKIYV
ncbi:carbonic anhydrase 2-like [Planococcus citri]|uniref:carbonic anhydrase 2-like n=1 Tax=Planococcus citri TaxID=170843 RepID=UPI0031F86213